MQTNDPQDLGPGFTWKLGGLAFAATMMVMIGAFQVIAGLAAILSDNFFVVGEEYVFELDPTAWGWIHFLLGGVVLAAGVSLFMGKSWAAAVALFLAVLVAVANFFYIPYYPFWSLLIIGLCVWVIWSLTKPTPTRM